MPKKFTFDDATKGEDVTPPCVPERKPKAFSFDSKPVEPTPPVVARKPKVIAPPSSGEAHYARKERVQTITDILVAKAKQQSPEISGEIRGKIDTLLSHCDTQTMLKWGDLNLAPLQLASQIQSEIANELQRINAVGTLTEAKEAATRGIGFLDRLAGKRPEVYEQRLKASKDALLALMVRSETQRKSYAPEVKDLHGDAISLAVTLTEFSDPVLSNIANSRTKTLLMAHQTGTILLQTLENTVQQCAALIGQIDSFMSVSMPNWKLASQSK